MGTGRPPLQHSRSLTTDAEMLHLPRPLSGKYSIRSFNFRGADGFPASRHSTMFLDANHEQNEIRLTGIDALEKSQPLGQHSKQSMSAPLFGKEVDVQ